MKGGTVMRAGATGMLVAMAMLVHLSETPMGSVESADWPRMHEALALGARLEVLVSGFQWAEGPVWVNGSLLLSDVRANVAYEWRPGVGVQPLLRPSGTADAADLVEPGSNGLLLSPLDPSALVLMNHGDRRVEAVRLDGSQPRETLASHFQGRRLNSPNDGVFDSRGNLYFTDPSYGLKRHGGPRNGEDAPDRELDFNGVYRLAFDRATGLPAPAGPELLVRDLTRPNGIGLSPDESRLYVAVSDGAAPRWMVYDVLSDGGLARGRVFLDAAPLRALGGGGLEGNPDGLAVANTGTVFATGPGGVHVIAPDGTHVGVILTGVKTGNCAIGEDGFLYVTADTHLARIALASGVGPVR